MTETHPSPVRRALPWIAAGFVIVLLAAIAGMVYAYSRSKPTGTVVASPSSAAPRQLSETEACAQLAPLLSSSASHMTAVMDNPDRPTDDIAATAASLRALEPEAPASWRPDIAVQYTDLQALVDAHGDRGRIAAVANRGDAWLASALRLTGGCKPYTVG